LIEDRGLRIEDRGLRIEDRLPSILNPKSSILYIEAGRGKTTRFEKESRKCQTLRHETNFAIAIATAADPVAASYW
jgi:hypothetical protein